MRLLDYIHQGGAVMYLLVLLNVVGIAIIIAKAAALRRALGDVEATADRLAGSLPDRGDGAALVELARQELGLYVHGMERGLGTVKIIASISPLLGLLGTVVGVLIAFRVMSQTGLSNPAAFAGGISMALITTVGGMVVAIPNFIGHSYLLGVLDAIEARLERRLIAKVL